MKMERLFRLLAAARLWSAPFPVSAVVLGSCLAYLDHGAFHPAIFLLQVLCLVSAFATTNLVNTYCDYINNIDDRESDDRTLVDRILAPHEVLIASFVAALISSSLCGLLAILSPAGTFLLTSFFVLGITAGVQYTAGFSLKYHALGDATVFLFGGVLSVLFVFLGQGGSVTSLPHVTFYSIPLALNIVTAMHCNNTRDLESDSKKKIKTVAICLGKRRSYYYFLALVSFPYLFLVGLATLRSLWFLLPLAFIPTTISCERKFASGSFDMLVPTVAKTNLLQIILYATAWVLQ